MKILIACFLFFLLYNGVAQAQTSEDSVKAVINRLFEGMKKSDTNALKSVFAEKAILLTISGKQDSTFTRSDEVLNMVRSIGSLPVGAADERIVIETIKIDGPLAIVWTPYKFYYNGKFSHCGVNSFQLLRNKKEWKIIYLIDTRRKGSCVN